MSTIELKFADKDGFEKWVRTLDGKTKKTIATRLTRMMAGDFGDSKRIGAIWEARIHLGPGIRIYFGRIGNVVVVVLAAGDKGSQSRDITKALKMWEDWK